MAPIQGRAVATEKVAEVLQVRLQILADESPVPYV
jgi:hypothetical protein